ncbi:putative E3 ubiquitin-protein ligase RHA2B [Morella rubra]|uniref:Putative E3 ubiquitin-protein ligase RHA2B n=1 Tax=Morella rubra TaxID=262757 RepID=A0A6A1V3S9_9ROSI|nr:putative E3 ubiquitin-protein ligase RHA2B [Morella rubra]KAB1206507.1 putative E3 ubiquitin-protein ligase RHA2B [Morella rubra]
MSRYVTLAAASNLRWACNCLIYQAFSKPYARDVPEVVLHQEPSVVRLEHEPGSSEVECSVCLSKIEDGDEIRRLRCDHPFHRVCLDRWLGYKNPTCPLRRESLAPFRAITELGMEVLSSKFSSSRSADREKRWLR